MTIQNLGLKDSSGLTTSISGPNAADFSVAAGTQPYLLSCVGGTVGALNKCTFLVSFKPSAEVTETATLTITDAQGASTTVTLTGKGGHPAVSFNPAAISFGSVGYRTDNVLYATATNTGTGPLQFKSATVTGSTDFSVAGGCLGGMGVASGLGGMGVALGLGSHVLLRRLTRDQSLVQMLIDSGAARPWLRHHPKPAWCG